MYGKVCVMEGVQYVQGKSTDTYRYVPHPIGNRNTHTDRPGSVIGPRVMADDVGIGIYTY